MACPNCGSRLIQPLRQHPRGSDEVLVDLRCPECHTFVQSSCTQADIRELDRRQSASRAEIVNAYERSVSENMEALADCLGRALALDLAGADDFAPPRRLRRAA
jgi:threonine synthase